MLHDKPTGTLTYVVYDPATKDCVVIDPVLDFNNDTFQTSTDCVDKVVAIVEANALKVAYVIDTHVHADHLTGSAYLKEKFGCKSVMSIHITSVQKVFSDILDLPAMPCDGSQFDLLVGDGDKFTAGSLSLEAIHTPGHTPACTCYKIGNLLFTGDALFMPDFGTGRCDFPKGSADDLYTSIKKLYTLPDDTIVYVGHDYCPGGREMKYMTTIGESKQANKQLKAETSREEFVTWRTERDATLAPPKLLYQSLQVNINNGVLPERAGNGQRYMKMPLNTLKDTNHTGDPMNHA